MNEWVKAFAFVSTLKMKSAILIVLIMLVVIWNQLLGTHLHIWTCKDKSALGQLERQKYSPGQVKSERKFKMKLKTGRALAWAQTAFVRHE